MEDAQKRMVIVVQPDGSFLAFPCPLAVARNISVIAHTALVTGQKKPVAIARETFAGGGTGHSVFRAADRFGLYRTQGTRLRRRPRL